MAFIQVDADTVICVFPKVASLSIREALSQVPHNSITAAEAALLSRRVAFFRNPIQRLKSFFNQVWWGVHNNVNFDEFMTDRVVTAYGGKILEISITNAHHWTDGKENEYQAFLTDLKDEFPTYTRTQLADRSNQRDYERFVDHILSGNDDPHWKPQAELSEDEGVFVPNIIKRFEDINAEWANFVGGTLPKLNSWQNIPTQDYRLNDLRAFYSQDLFRRGE